MSVVPPPPANGAVDVAVLALEPGAFLCIRSALYSAAPVPALDELIMPGGTALSAVTGSLAGVPVLLVQVPVPTSDRDHTSQVMEEVESRWVQRMIVSVRRRYPATATPVLSDVQARQAATFALPRLALHLAALGCVVHDLLPCDTRDTSLSLLLQCMPGIRAIHSHGRSALVSHPLFASTEDLRALGALPDLGSLTISHLQGDAYAPIVAGAEDVLHSFTRLTRLRLIHSGKSLTRVIPCSSPPQMLQQLQSLEIHSCYIEPNACARLAHDLVANGSCLQHLLLTGYSSNWVPLVSPLLCMRGASLRTLHLSDCGESGVAALGACGADAQAMLTELHLANCIIDDADAAGFACFLAEQPCLTKLCLVHARMSSKSAEAIADALRCLLALRLLDLSHLSGTDTAVLLPALHGTPLIDTLVLRACLVNPHQLVHLVNELPLLRRLDLGDTTMRPAKAATVLLDSLSSRRSLRELDMNRCTFDRIDWPRIITAVPAQIRTLVLDAHACLASSWRDSLACCRDLSRLEIYASREVNSLPGISDQLLQKLALSLHGLGHCIDVLAISDLPGFDHHLDLLAQPISRLSRLRRLLLSDFTVVTLPSALPRMLASLVSLTYLDLSGTKVSQDGLPRVMTSLGALRRLQVLRLADCDLDDAAVTALASVIPALPRLQSLMLWRNSIADSVHALSQALHRAPRISYVDLSENPIAIVPLRMAQASRRYGLWLPRHGNAPSPSAAAASECLQRCTAVRSLVEQAGTVVLRTAHALDCRHLPGDISLPVLMHQAFLCVCCDQLFLGLCLVKLMRVSVRMTSFSKDLDAEVAVCPSCVARG